MVDVVVEILKYTTANVEDYKIRVDWTHQALVTLQTNLQNYKFLQDEKDKRIIYSFWASKYSPRSCLNS